MGPAKTKRRLQGLVPQFVKPNACMYVCMYTCAFPRQSVHFLFAVGICPSPPSIHFPSRVFVEQVLITHRLQHSIMGVTLPKPLMTKLHERDGNDIFLVGSSCVNGYRENMEDAHIAKMIDNWGFFGVFDGHVNEKCSAYLEGAWNTALDKEKIPISDERMKELTLQIDKEWLDREGEGGSTGTYFMAYKEGNIVKLQVANVGDSRVLVSKKGACVSMTEDHKPNNEEERARIERYGGRVENNRVDGSLAISRAFGDRDYKQNNGDQLEQRVIALADVTHVDVDWNSDDFAALCCDGVFESDFTNEQVIEFIQEKLKECSDLAEVGAMVCEEAIRRGSRDNISCMIVQFKSGVEFAKSHPHIEVVPGPFNAKSSAFLKMYKVMAAKGGMEVGAALEKRYDTIKKNPELADDEEIANFGEGPAANLTGAERTAHFTKLFEEQSNKQGAGRNENLARFSALQQQMGIPMPVLMALMSGAGADDDGK